MPLQPSTLLFFIFSLKYVETLVTYMATFILDLEGNIFRFQICFVTCSFLEMVEIFYTI